ncbi:MAG: helicase C-terminal domain-containing protein [Tepidisphaeraceae bacterium]
MDDAPATTPETPPSMIDAILGAGGAVARRLGDRYEPRPQQLEMAHAVDAAFKQGGHLLVEAGTGVGKSFAYLLPAIEAAVKRKKRVVISTHTISLQEQLVDKDIPLLASVYPDEFTAVLVKGRNNFLCRRRLDSAMTNRQLLFDDARHQQTLGMVHEWSQNTTDGTLSSLPQLPDPAVWDEVKAEHGNCLGKRCTHYENCFWQAAKRRMTSANLLIVNHALFFSDLALRSTGINYLPRYDHVIFDEAHTIEDVAGQHFAVRLSEASLKFVLRQLYDCRKGKGLLSLHGACAADACNAVVEAMSVAEDFFDQCATWQERYGRGNGRIREKGFVTSTLSSRLNDVARQITAIYPHLDEKKPEQLLELQAKAMRVQQLAQMVDVLTDQTMEEAVYWMDVSKRTPRRVTLSAAPVDVSAGLRKYLFEKTKSVVLTSATLCTSGTSSSQRTPQFRGTGVPPVSPRSGPELRQGAYLPPLTESQAIYAVNFRLADSLPTSAQSSAPTPETDESSIAELLDKGHGSCILRDPRAVRIVQDALLHFDDEQYRLLAWCVMPNHVHAVLQPIGDNHLPAILHAWKSFTAPALLKLFPQQARIWQAEYFDRLVRDRDELARQVEYAELNSECAGIEDWPWRGRNDEQIEAALSPSENHGRDARATNSGAPHVERKVEPLPQGFRYIAKRLGLDRASTLQLGSPFDYTTQATLYLETNLPDPSDAKRFVPAATQKVEHYLRHTHGGAFVLFTSYSMLRQMADQLRSTLEHLGMPVLIQGQDLTPRQLLNRFRELDDAVLFGTSSFWQGIDVQGHKLRNVIIVKLPFSVPDEPIIEAKHEHITRLGGNPFMDLSLPEAIIRLKQGFGRLIRAKTDKGIVVLLDSRVKTKRYGRQFLDALPDVKVVEVEE